MGVSRVLEFLHPHLELFGIGPLEEARHLGCEIGVGFPSAFDLFCECDGAIVGLSDHQLHGGLIRWVEADRLDCFFEFLGGTEGDLLAGLDLDRFAGGRIAPHPRWTLADLQDAEAAEANAPAFLEMTSDRLDHASEHVVGLGLRNVVGLGQDSGQMAERYGFG